MHRVHVACAPCKAAKARCDLARPCGRCVRFARVNQCIDCIQKKRGRKRKQENIIEGGVVNMTTTTTTTTTTTLSNTSYHTTINITQLGMHENTNNDETITNHNKNKNEHLDPNNKNVAIPNEFSDSNPNALSTNSSSLSIFTSKSLQNSQIEPPSLPHPPSFPHSHSSSSSSLSPSLSSALPTQNLPDHSSSAIGKSKRISLSLSSSSSSSSSSTTATTSTTSASSAPTSVPVPVLQFSPTKVTSSTSTTPSMFPHDTSFESRYTLLQPPNTQMKKASRAYSATPSFHGSFLENTATDFMSRNISAPSDFSNLFTNEHRITNINSNRATSLPPLMLLQQQASSSSSYPARQSSVSFISQSEQQKYTEYVLRNHHTLTVDDICQYPPFVNVFTQEVSKLLAQWADTITNEHAAMRTAPTSLLRAHKWATDMILSLVNRLSESPAAVCAALEDFKRAQIAATEDRARRRAAGLSNDTLSYVASPAPQNFLLEHEITLIQEIQYYLTRNEIHECQNRFNLLNYPMTFASLSPSPDVRTLFNEAFSNLLGFTWSDLDQRLTTLSDIMHIHPLDEMHDLIRCVFTAIGHGESFINRRGKWTHHDGHILEVHENLFITYAEPGTPNSILCVIKP
jgi:hypothetical protein